MSNYLTFVVFAILLALAPGPDTFITLRVTVAGGKPRGLWTVTGIIVANVVLGTLAASGLGAVIASSKPVFDALRWIGVVYLGWLGLQAVISAFRSDTSAWQQAGGGHVRPMAAMRQGFLSTFTNPKALAFYVAILPPFVSPHATFVELMAYALTLAFFGTIYLTAIVFAAHGAMRLIRRDRVRRGIEGGVGLVMIGFAAALAVQD
ncbi:lysine transporter LysE [Nocardioides baekrokdamisoli]|uniref:Lysine transporter LysE n=1 Tax=Nocardioides baekrokdamisoli TaxID=1804624 RepID=A0A3G9IYM4_9ACTN|nr:LysE family translocator [Nocardioides baekrokdamisoli]BBH16274.1 lysine transporter LysE [Nocardioides baekrokdamisoli]